MLKVNSGKRKLLILGISIAVLLLIRLINFIIIPGERQFTLYLSLSWLANSVVLIFIANFSLNWLFNSYLPWNKYAIWRFVVQLISGTIISLVCLNISYGFIKDEFTAAPADSDQILLLNIYGFAMILPIFALYFGVKFLRAWRKSEIETERLQKENAHSQMMTLRNHLDPHFLFNNLNILSSLIDQDSEISKTYLDKFAEVYRIILRADAGDLTSLSDELKLIESYMYLLNIRFRDSIQFELDINEEDSERVLPPLSIQMLIENALKHNKASVNDPIHISIRSLKDGYIRIKNNIQKKKFMPVERQGTGLINIKKRYAYFTDKQVHIRNDNNQFIVDLPILDVDYD